MLEKFEEYKVLIT